MHASRLRPWTGAGAYDIMLNLDEGDRVIEALGGELKYARLAAIRQRYDPAGRWPRP